MSFFFCARSNRAFFVVHCIGCYPTISVLLFTCGPAIPKSAYSCLFLLNSAYSCLFRHKEAYFLTKICIYQKKCVPLSPQSKYPYFCSFFTPLGSPKHGNDTDSTRNRVRGKCTLNREQSLPNNHLLWHESN